MESRSDCALNSLDPHTTHCSAEQADHACQQHQNDAAWYTHALILCPTGHVVKISIQLVECTRLNFFYNCKSCESDTRLFNAKHKRIKIECHRNMVKN